MKATPEHFAARRGQIMLAALTCFGLKGVQGATMRDIAIEAELSTGVLYRYFRTPVPDLPGDEYTRFSEVKTFSRLDVNVSPSNLFNVTVATFPQQVDFANLNTFNLAPVSTGMR